MAKPSFNPSSEGGGGAKPSFTLTGEPDQVAKPSFNPSSEGDGGAKPSFPPSSPSVGRREGDKGGGSVDQRASESHEMASPEPAEGSVVDLVGEVTKTESQD